MVRRLERMCSLVMAGAIVIGVGGATAQSGGSGSAAFGPSNPFYAASTLPFQAPPFDKIKDTDYQPAIEAGIAQQMKETDAIANNPDAPTFDNTIVAMEKDGQLLTRVTLVFFGVTQANTNPTLQKVQEIVTPKLTALQDSIYLNSKLFARVQTLYDKRSTLNLDAESMRLLEVDYREFVKAGAKLNDADKAKKSPFSPTPSPTNSSPAQKPQPMPPPTRPNWPG
jgi:peptidyl-dipeptidase Dcp